jgi:pyruvate dehydrogenase E2 component (dihydrolipoamide acetyltransferase)
MASEITMPKLSDTMEEGTLVSWKKSVGEMVKRGDIIAEIETDKANMDLEAFVSGVLLETRVKPGEVVPVGTVIALVGEAGEKPAAKQPEEPEMTVAEAERTKPPEQKAVPPEEKGKKEKEEKEEKIAVPISAREKASPLVRRIAREHGVDLGEVEGTGPEGRILREDIDKFIEAGEKGKKEEVAVAVEAKREARGAEGKIEPHSRMRKAIARSVVSSWHTIPHFSVSISVDMGAAEAMHRSLRKAGESFSINDLIIKASSMTLRKHPRLNASYSDEGTVYYPEINIGIVVSVEGGLLVPVVGSSDTLTLKELSVKSSDLVERARQGKISEPEISGGTFTVSNLGMFGVDNFSAIIYPNQAAVLAVAAISDAVVVREGRIVPARMMQATLSADHRLVDGTDAARFLSDLKKVLENPLVMMV